MSGDKRSLADARGSERGCSDVLAYFITFHTYGTWFHGDERGSVDPDHNIYGTETLAQDGNKSNFQKGRLNQPPILLDDNQRSIVERTINEVAGHRGWVIRAINVRSNHVHVVAAANAKPEKVMNDFKAWATRRLAEAGAVKKGSRV